MEKAKRKLSDFNFDFGSAHVALVGPAVGGPANGYTCLMQKSLNPNEESMEMIEKAAHEELLQKAVSLAVEPVQKALDAAKAELDILKAAQVEAAQKARKASLAEVMGEDNEKLDAEFEVLKSLDDTVFQLVLKSKKEAAEAIEKSAMFNEVGAPGKAEVVDGESAEMKILKAKYNKK